MPLRLQLGLFNWFQSVCLFVFLENGLSKAETSEINDFIVGRLFLSTICFENTLWKVEVYL